VTSTSTKTNAWGWKFIAKLIYTDVFMVAEAMVVVIQKWRRSASGGDGKNTAVA
jgi:hypothetical protein